MAETAAWRPGLNFLRAAGSKAAPTRRSAKRGLSCHRNTAMTVWPMRSGILPSIRLLAPLAEVTVPLQRPPFRQTLEFSAQRLPATP